MSLKENRLLVEIHQSHQLLAILLVYCIDIRVWRVLDRVVLREPLDLWYFFEVVIPSKGFRLGHLPHLHLCLDDKIACLTIIAAQKHPILTTFEHI